ncbi:MAG: tRNA (adenosine(37)-N6)-threonylcarbamoyltransferase complex transferase subunit TsaD [Parcubacteria group bacterium]|nr:tRNA (adenosine(37)-N6)-threonylcarbamoyltransferase complex transferase subunit TsaD [Parcubacteria group bacterium]
MKIFAIETSCDETAASVVEARGGSSRLAPRFIVLSRIVSSQINIHRKYGGIVPEVAARKHAENLLPVVLQALGTVKPSAVDYIAVTVGPGLITSLVPGVEVAKILSFLWKKPIVGVNHLIGHILSPFAIKPIQKIKFPLIALLVSGGHTELILLKNFVQYKKIGETVDDAAGECFDKSAKILGLPYPGGPEISKRATRGDKNAFHFPRPMLQSNDFNFSFSGLKTAVLYEAQKIGVARIKRNKKMVNDFCASIEEAIIDVLAQKTIKAVEKYKPHGIILAGGVAANPSLRDRLAREAAKRKLPFYTPPLWLCTDNATMIAVAAYFQIANGKIGEKIDADPSLDIRQ